MQKQYALLSVYEYLQYANHEEILQIRLPQLQNILAVTETLPNTAGKGINVASVLVDCNKSISLRRIANPTNRLFYCLPVLHDCLPVTGVSPLTFLVRLTGLDIEVCKVTPNFGNFAKFRHISASATTASAR